MKPGRRAPAESSHPDDDFPVVNQEGISDASESVLRINASPMTGVRRADWRWSSRSRSLGSFHPTGTVRPPGRFQVARCTGVAGGQHRPEPVRSPTRCASRPRASDQHDGRRDAATTDSALPTRSQFGQQKPDSKPITANGLAAACARANPWRPPCIAASQAMKPAHALIATIRPAQAKGFLPNGSPATSCPAASSKLKRGPQSGSRWLGMNGGRRCRVFRPIASRARAETPARLVCAGRRGYAGSPCNAARNGCRW